MGDLSRPDWTGRLLRINQDRERLGLRALVISTLPNITYLTGFTGTAGLLVLSAGESRLVVDGRYEATARRLIRTGAMAAIEVEPVGRRYDTTLSAVLRGLGTSTTDRIIGFEAQHVTVATLTAWRAASPPTDWRSTERVVEHRRAVKDLGEVAILRRAARLLSEIAWHLSECVAEGLTEREVARSIDLAIDRAGFEAPAFPTIVASGPNTAQPHARPTDRRLARGDLVMLDFGGRLDGYCGDLTRMAAVGQVGPEARSLFEAVREAQAAAIAAVRPGLLASAVDQAAREVLERRGLAEAVLHATGHGLGLELHEAPRIARPDPHHADRLETGMVCTIEPGAYVEGLGGVRLEDDVLVTVDGCERLTDAPPDLVVV
jgi:Xaa-Pro aminopeptidase